MNEVRKQRRERNRTASRLVAELLEARAERDRAVALLHEVRPIIGSDELHDRVEAFLASVAPASSRTQPTTEKTDA